MATFVVCCLETTKGCFFKAVDKRTEGIVRKQKGVDKKACIKYLQPIACIVLIGVCGFVFGRVAYICLSAFS